MTRIMSDHREAVSTVVGIALLTAFSGPLQGQVSQSGKSVLDGVLGTLDSRYDHHADEGE